MSENKEVIIISRDKEYKANIVKRNPDGTYVVRVENEESFRRIYPENVKENKKEDK